MLLRMALGDAWSSDSRTRTVISNKSRISHQKQREVNYPPAVLFLTYKMQEIVRGIWSM